MNYHLAALIAVGSLVAAGSLRLIYHHVCGLSARTANDVYPFLLKIDMEAVYGTFHPDPESTFARLYPKLNSSKCNSSAFIWQFIIAPAFK
jgi:hypothetical protein